MNEAGLHIISASDLLKDDPYVKECLLAACQENGFFYLDYRSTALENLTELYGVAKDFFELSLEEKLKYDVEGQGPEKYDGYVKISISLPHLSVLRTQCRTVTR